MDTEINVLDDWTFVYNSQIQGIEAYNGKKSVVESQNICNGINESFERVADRLLIKKY